MKKILIGFFALVAFAACDKNDEGENISSPNKYRVTKITGSNDMWGDNFTLSVKYNSKNQIDKIYISNNLGDTITYIEGRRDNSDMVYTVNDYETDKDTGKLSKDSQKRYSVRNKMVGNILESQVVEINEPKTVIDPEDYEPEKYINVSYTKYIYEYDNIGRVKVARIMDKIYDTDPSDSYYNNDKFKTYISKLEVVYNADKVASVENYVSDQNIENANYRLLGSEIFEYSGGNLLSITSNFGKDKVSFDYSATEVKVGGVSYTVNGDRIVTKIVDANGKVFNIEYEAGSGNFGMLSPALNGVYSKMMIR